MRQRRLFLAAFAMIALPTFVANAGEPIRFSIAFTPLPIAGELTSIPRVEAISSPGSPLSEGAATQVIATINAQIRARHVEDSYAARFVAYSGIRVEALSQPRAKLVSLIDGYADSLERCFHALPEGEDTDHLYLVIRSSLPSVDDAAKSKRAGQAMADAFARDRCVEAHNTIPFSEEARPYLRAAAEVMLTGTFDRHLFFSDEQVVLLTDHLHPLFFGPKGLWVTEKGSELRAIVTDGSREGVLTDADFMKLEPVEFRTFFDFYAKAFSLKTSLPVEFIETVAARCVAGGREAFFQPFQMKRCMDAKNLHRVSLRVGDQDYVVVSGDDA